MSLEKRFAAKLLFKFCVDYNDGNDIEKTYEIRIVLIRAAGARSALSSTKEKGESLSWSDNQGEKTVSQKFVGVMDLICLEDVTDGDDEVWYEIFQEEDEKVIKSLIPDESKLDAILTND